MPEDHRDRSVGRVKRGGRGRAAPDRGLFSSLMGSTPPSLGWPLRSPEGAFYEGRLLYPLGRRGATGAWLVGFLASFVPPRARAGKVAQGFGPARNMPELMRQEGHS